MSNDSPTSKASREIKEEFEEDFEEEEEEEEDKIMMQFTFEGR